jgi:peptidoglycan-associated lipoprotein
VAFVLLSLLSAACAKKKAPVLAAPAPAPAPSAATPSSPAPAPRAERVEESLPVPPEPLAEDSIGTRSLDDLNRESPFKPAFFGYDSAELDPAAQKVVQENAALLKKYATWTVTIEGHCDERGTPEYNLALGERRAMAVKTYLVSLGIPADRVRIVSYGKEFPFDAGHDDSAWNKNRRAHFVITSK